MRESTCEPLGWHVWYFSWVMHHSPWLHALFFHYFWFFLNSPGPPPRSRSHSRCHRCLPGGVEPWFGLGSRVPHPQGTSLYFSPIFLVCISCSPSAKLDWKGFRAKIIHYMAASRDNSQPPGCGTPGRSPTHEN
jgi:hypothetical protein